MEIKCPNCGSIKSVKAGETPQGKQRYKCHDCARRFTSVTRSIFHSQKLQAKTLRRLLALIIRDEMCIRDRAAPISNPITRVNILICPF